MTTKTIYLIRHGQAEHNVIYDYSIHDAPLTLLGRQQAAALNDETKDTIQQTAELLVSSPLRRAIQTLLLAFPTLKARLHHPVILLPDLQELQAYPCDTGSPRATLEADPEFSPHNLDFSHLTPDWTSKTGPYDPAPACAAARARRVRRWLREREEGEIVVVSHGTILGWIVGGEIPEPWGNAEIRAFTFRSEDDDEAELVELSMVERRAREGQVTVGVPGQVTKL